MSPTPDVPRTSPLSPLAQLGWDMHWQNEWDDHPGDDDHRFPGRVVRVDRGACDVLTAAGGRRAALAPSVLSRAHEDPSRTACVGDWVVLRDEDGGAATVDAILPRRTEVVRAAVTPGASYGQVLVANLDTAVVVEPLFPQPDVARIERFLALIWPSGAQPVVLLTKADLVGDADDMRDDVALAAPGADVLVASVVAGLPERVLAVFAPGRTVALVGPSGAGKSSLVNALASTDRMATRALRGDVRGRHTTVHRELVVLPGGALVVDTPGLRRVGLPGSTGGLEQAFSDVDELAEKCRFRDCEHCSEPGCAVAAAIAEGDLAPRRLASWHKLAREQAWMERRGDARLMAEARAGGRRLSRQMRGGQVRR